MVNQLPHQPQLFSKNQNILGDTCNDRGNILFINQLLDRHDFEAI